MKKLFLLSLVLLTASVGFAQKHQSLSATVVRTVHRAAVTKSESTSGHFYFKQPDRLCLTFSNGREALIMNGSTYTLVRKGRRSVAQGDMQKAFEPLQEVLKALCSGVGTKGLKGKQGLSFTTSAGTTTINIVPPTTSDKAARRLLFRSFVVSVDSRTNEIKTLRMVGRGKNNYTDYSFSSIAYNRTLGDDLFK